MASTLLPIPFAGFLFFGSFSGINSQNSAILGLQNDPKDTTYVSESYSAPKLLESHLNASSTKEELREYALLKAQEYGVSFHEMSVTIDCESGWNPRASNPTDSDGGSWGIVQINIGKNAHPDITKEQAFDPEFALDFMASEFAKGQQWKWTCYNNNF